MSADLDPLARPAVPSGPSYSFPEARMFAFDLPPPRRTATSLFLALAVALAAAACVDLTGSSEPKVKVPADSIEVVWWTRLGSAGPGSTHDLATDGKRLFVPVGDGVEALDLDTGERLWQARKVVHSSVTIASRGERVFIAEGLARALNARTGAELWRFNPDTSYSGRATADEHAFYFGTRSGRVYALSQETGTLLWSVELAPATLYGARGIRVLPHGDTVYASIVEDLSPTGHLKRGIVVALDRGTGRELWRFINEEPEVWHSSDASVVEGRMLLVSDLNGNRFFALDRFTGKEVWSYQGSPGYFGPGQGIHVHAGVGYVASSDAYVYAFDPEAGRLRWKTYVGGSADAVTTCGDHLFVALMSLYKMDRTDGKIVAQLFAGSGSQWVESRLLAHGNRLFFMGNQRVYAVSCE